MFTWHLSSGIYPMECPVQGLIFPIYKTGDLLNPSNYRGIAITSCLSKVFNSILNARLEKYILKNEIIRNEQIGFKAGCRTSDHIFKLKTIIDKYLNKSKKVYACFIDLRKAFDSVIHSALFLNSFMLKSGINFWLY
jgi:potassium voltage-gated channel Eag-related subfamily H protein 8